MSTTTDAVRDYLAYCSDPDCPGDDCYGGDCPCGHHSAREAWAIVYEVVDAARDFVGPHDWAGSIGGPDIAAAARAHRLVESVERVT